MQCTDFIRHVPERNIAGLVSAALINARLESADNGEPNKVPPCGNGSLVVVAVASLGGSFGIDLDHISRRYIATKI